MEVATIIHAYSYALTEAMTATEWQKYKKMLHKLHKAA
jgi:hypothetical protein